MLPGIMVEERVMVAGIGQRGEGRGKVAPNQVLLPVVILTLLSHLLDSLGEEKVPASGGGKKSRSSISLSASSP